MASTFPCTAGRRQAKATSSFNHLLAITQVDITHLNRTHFHIFWDVIPKEKQSSIPSGKCKHAFCNHWLWGLPPLVRTRTGIEHSRRCHEASPTLRTKHKISNLTGEVWQPVPAPAKKEIEAACDWSFFQSFSACLPVCLSTGQSVCPPHSVDKKMSVCRSLRREQTINRIINHNEIESGGMRHMVSLFLLWNKYLVNYFPCGSIVKSAFKYHRTNSSKKKQSIV